MEYKLTFDYHTHTIHSHGKGTIRENVMAAREKGLTEIAITDHGPGHLEHGLKREDIPEMRRIVTELNKEFDDIKIYLGVEANIIDTEFALDVLPDEFSNFDFVIAGYHYGLKNGHNGENWREFYMGYHNKKVLIRNTDMALRAIYDNDLKILTHPGDKASFDMIELAKACAETNTLMEINTQHDALNSVQIKQCAEFDVQFILSSDAHTPEDVGEFSYGLRRAINAGIDLDRIVNLRKVEI